MISQEMFDGIVAKVVANEPITTEEATELVQTIAEFEQRTALAQHLVEFVLHSAEQIFDGAITDSLRVMPMRDLAKVKQVRAIGRKAASNLTAVSQLYIAQMAAQAQQESAVADVDTSAPEEEVPA
jgi:hypothetical protein